MTQYPAVGDMSPDHDAKLRRVLSAFPGRGSAVLDGARFEDLPKLCRRERLFVGRYTDIAGATDFDMITKATDEGLKTVRGVLKRSDNAR